MSTAIPGETCRTSGLVDLHAGAIRRLAHLHKCAGGVLWLRRDDEFAAIAPCRMPLPARCAESVDSGFSRKLAEEWVIEFDAGSASAAVLPAWVDRVPDLEVAVPLLVERELIGFIGLQRSLGIKRIDDAHLATLKTAARSAAAKIARAQA